MTTTTQSNEKAAPAVQLPVDLRDYFAAKAMQAMVQGHFSHYGHDNYWPRDQIAAEAYEMADAMLKESSK